MLPNLKGLEDTMLSSLWQFDSLHRLVPIMDESAGIEDLGTCVAA